MCRELSKSDFAPRAGGVSYLRYQRCFPLALKKRGANRATGQRDPSQHLNRTDAPWVVEKTDGKEAPTRFIVPNKRYQVEVRHPWQNDVQDQRQRMPPSAKIRAMSVPYKRAQAHRGFFRPKTNSRQRWILTKVPANVVVRGLLFVHKDGQSTD
jgi:hypothetical protein